MGELFLSGHALIVGVGADLPNTIDDAKGIAEILKDPLRCAYEPHQIRLLTGEEATRDTILNALDYLAQGLAPDATVIIYFSGHGYRVSSQLGQFYYLMPYGYNTAKLSTTAISGTEFVQKLKAIPAQKLIVLLDCCHAGGVGEVKALDIEFSKSPLPPEALGFLVQGGGLILIASSKDDELSYAGKPYSVFTLALIEALCGIGVAKKDGFVRVADLALHAREVVAGRTKEKQHPVLHFEHADNFVMAYYAGGETHPKGSPFDEEPEIEPEPGAWTNIDQSQTAVQGSMQIGNSIVEGGFYQPNLTIQGNAIHTQGDINHNESIKVGDIKDSTGIAIGHGAQARVTEQTFYPGDEITRAFIAIKAALESLPVGTAKEEASDAIDKLEAEARKGDSADEGRVRRWLNSLAETAPDAWDVALDTFVQPIKDINTIFKKIAEHTKKEK